MPRQAKPAVQKLKEQIIELPPDEAQEVYDWLDMLLEVREQDAAAAKRRQATAQEKP